LSGNWILKQIFPVTVAIWSAIGSTITEQGFHMEDRAQSILEEYAAAGVSLRKRFFEQNSELLSKTARSLAVTMAREGKVMLCGNGGSAADCQHIAAEFTNRFLLERPPLPALALTTDTSALTAIGNDYSFDQVFEKQIRALGRKGDALVAISTSGNSPNVLKAIEAARELGIMVVGLTGMHGGAMGPLCDHLIEVSETSTPLIQEIHIATGHIICRLVDYYLFENVTLIQPDLGA
jgi:D-sedoheptulose 7-phosphate isomerase